VTGTRAPAGGRSRARRELTLALLLCAVGSAVALVAATRGWVTVRVPRPSPLSAVTAEGTGRAVEPVVPALGVVGLAGVVGLLATRRTGRVVLGVLLAAAGVAVAVRALVHLSPPSQADVLALLDARGPVVGLRSDTAAAARTHPLWPVLAACGGLALCAGGLVTLLRSRAWPAMSGRYDRAGTRPAGTAGGGTAAGAARTASNHDLWDALDRGEDPTR
jgi:uncharacterized membrane protein (TIGR02234 family)